MKHQRIEDAVRHPYEARPVRIVADAAVSSRGVLGGRLVPLLILDTSDRPDIEELIRVHQTSKNPGDVKIQWARLQGHEDSVALFVTFIRPSEATIVLEFEIVKQGILVEQALIGRAIYIQAGREGDRLIEDPNRPKVLFEIGDTGFTKDWDSMCHKHLARYFRSKGLGRAEAKRAARATIVERRKIGSFRMPDPDMADSQQQES